jgi:hypothetical protein
MARDLSDTRPVDQDNGTNILNGIFTSEFWTTIGGLVANLVVLLVAVGWVSSDDGSALSGQITAFLAAAQALLVNGALIWKYISSRTQLKQSITLQQMAERHDLKLTQIRLLMSGDNPAHQAQAMKMMGVYESPKENSSDDECDPSTGCCQKGG